MEHNQIGNKIRELRMSRNLTQAELGKLVGVSMQAVSKWERGGTPDIEVLLLLAEHFGVTMDEIFGRKIDASDDLNEMLYNVMLQAPDKNKIELACQYCWSIFKGMSDIPEMQNVDYCTAKPCHPENTRSRVATNEGIGYALATREAHMVAIMPEPKEGYGVTLASVDAYTELFRFLSDPDVFRLFLFLFTRSQSLFSKKLASQAVNVSEEKVEAVFDAFEKREWLAKERADMGDESVTLYRATYKEYFAFFLHFTNELMIAPRFWYLSNANDRTNPLLKKLPE